MSPPQLSKYIYFFNNSEMEQTFDLSCTYIIKIQWDFIVTYKYKIKNRNIEFFFLCFMLLTKKGQLKFKLLPK